jgi:pilus assembly protein Flp/PilA
MLKLLAPVRALVAARLDRGDRGATAVEYGLMVALIAAVIIGAVTLIGTDINTIFGNVITAL